jgi:hypothetical protein
MSDRRKNTPERHQKHKERRLTNRSNHSPEAAEVWRLEGRHAPENVSHTLESVSPDKWTVVAFAGKHCVVGPFSNREQAEAFSHRPDQWQDYSNHFFQLRSSKNFWFVEVFPDGQGRLMNEPDLADNIKYGNLR